ncbi:histidine kinase dimerization/phospho-acceptor domain-containing protein [Polynucleobacter necessarius]|uniref:histidine kinase dimerization/phospho-acceptor domain-containing protein n=1 Tax=Polynucleobacter necessarius TaxID=576610 RepID=UPI0018D529C2|nr:histidine kinase dimerization/phospho-acceptor domain-containing protein [Polynucleobacter necessarius]
MQYASSAELFFALGRLAILIVSTFTIRQVEQIPQILILFTIAQLVMNTLSYIAIGGYWAKQITLANAQSRTENKEIKALLQERETPIGSLLRANKTASTGALSASIAHELNQPLGASSLNIQFMQKKLLDGGLSPALQKEILETLLSDNERAANIIRSLRAIFLEIELACSNVDLGELLDVVINITRPEIAAQNIQMILQVDSELTIQANTSEIQ